MTRNDALLPAGAKPWTIDEVPRDSRWDRLWEWLLRPTEPQRDEPETVERETAAA